MDKKHARDLTDDEVMAAALSDPDAQPLTDEQLAKMRRVPMAKRLRRKFGISREEFSRRFRIPLGTLGDWEHHRAEPDPAMLAYLQVIEREPEAVERALGAVAAE